MVVSQYQYSINVSVCQSGNVTTGAHATAKLLIPSFRRRTRALLISTVTHDACDSTHMGSAVPDAMGGGGMDPIEDEGKSFEGACCKRDQHLCRQLMRMQHSYSDTLTEGKL